jgi:hypothetical protein
LLAALTPALHLLPRLDSLLIGSNKHSWAHRLAVVAELLLLLLLPARCMA